MFTMGNSIDNDSQDSLSWYKYELHWCMVTHVLCYILYLKCALHVAEVNRFLMSPATGRKSSNKKYLNSK